MGIFLRFESQNIFVVIELYTVPTYNTKNITTKQIFIILVIL